MSSQKPREPLLYEFFRQVMKRSSEDEPRPGKRLIQLPPSQVRQAISAGVSSLQQSKKYLAAPLSDPPTHKKSIQFGFKKNMDQTDENEQETMPIKYKEPMFLPSFYHSPPRFIPVDPAIAEEEEEEEDPPKSRKRKLEEIYNCVLKKMCQ